VRNCQPSAIDFQTGDGNGAILAVVHSIHRRRDQGQTECHSVELEGPDQTGVACRCNVGRTQRPPDSNAQQNGGGGQLKCEVVHDSLLVAHFAAFRRGRQLENFSQNRPDANTRNHQYTKRCDLITHPQKVIGCYSRSLVGLPTASRYDSAARTRSDIVICAFFRPLCSC
jgi:hypothetical protein